MSSPAPKRTRTPSAKASDQVETPAPLEHKKIARLAYAYWEARGCPHDSPEEDWFRAEEELRRRKSVFKVVRDRRRHSPRARISPRSRKSTG